MQTTPLNFEPVFVPAAAGNLFNINVTAMTGPVGVTLGKPTALIRHIRITNNDSASHTVTLYKGATAGSAAGTEFAFAGKVVPANDSIDWYAGAPGARFDAADFLTGVASIASKLTITLEGDVGLVTA